MQYTVISDNPKAIERKILTEPDLMLRQAPKLQACTTCLLQTRPELQPMTLIAWRYLCPRLRFLVGSIEETEGRISLGLAVGNPLLKVLVV
jgi:hypothetical protein